MNDEFLNFDMETLQETEETEKREVLEQQAQQYWEKYKEASEKGDMAAARYYHGKYSDICPSAAEEPRPSAIEEAEEDAAKGGDASLGSSEAEEEKEAREKLEAERSRLERKLRTAQQNLEHAQKALDTLLRNKIDGMTGVDTGISTREYQIKVYTKDIADLERQLSKL